MLKGCKKNVIYIKNTGSELFEEAYFIVCESSASGKRENDILDEANKIISNSPIRNYFLGDEPKRKTKKRFSALSFILGAAVMGTLNTLIYLLL